MKESVVTCEAHRQYDFFCDRDDILNANYVNTEIKVLTSL